MDLNPATDVPEIPVLLLGDAGVGKSTFLSRLTIGPKSKQALPALYDLDQPFPFDVRFGQNGYRLEFYDTASPTNYTLLQPAVIVMCYSIADPLSLESLQSTWKKTVEGHFNYDERIPVLVLGLKRDVRRKEDYDGSVRHNPIFDRIVYPQEALRIAQEMRCDRYCECSALTGDLCHEVFEDICKTAALTRTEGGGKTPGTQCTMM